MLISCAQAREGEAGELLGQVQAVEAALRAAAEQSGEGSASALAELDTHVQVRAEGCPGPQNPKTPNTLKPLKP